MTYMGKKHIWITVVIVLVVIGVIVAVEFADRKVAHAPIISSESASSTEMALSSGTASTTTAATSGLSVVFSTSTTQKHYAGPSFSLNYPSTWVASPSPFFSLDSFGGNYAADGMIPPGGAEIDIVTTTVSTSDDAVMATELMSATNLATSTVTVDDKTCQKAVYDDTYGADKPSNNISIYCLLGNELWKIYFSYHAGDPAAQQHQADFADVLRSLVLLPTIR